MDEQQANEHHWKVLVLTLKEIAHEKGITYDMISERTGMKVSNISRTFSLKFCPSLKNFISVARAIGINFFLEDQDGTSELNEAFERAMTELGRRVDRLPKN